LPLIPRLHVVEAGLVIEFVPGEGVGLGEGSGLLVKAHIAEWVVVKELGDGA
jgi:hypothetical protein